MEVVVAEHAGFCFGVKRAVDEVYKLAESGEQIYTYGPIIHNESVVEDLEKKGVRVIHNEEELSKVKSGTVVIRSHGVSKDIYDRIKAQGLNLVDATCPFVKRIHDIVQEESSRGKEILITGSPDHPEVEGIVGWVNGPVHILTSAEDAKKFINARTPESSGVSYCMVSQTTFNYKKFSELVEIFNEVAYNVNVVNTICNATHERQSEACELSERADVMIVIGGQSSSNTRKLYEICKERCAETYFIQTLDDLHLELPKAANLVGITAGASTPQNIIEEVRTYVRTRTEL